MIYIFGQISIRMKSLPKTVYKDKNGFYESGCQQFILCSAKVIQSEVYLSTMDTIFNCNNVSIAGEIVPAYYPHTIKVMKILDPRLGVLYIEPTDFPLDCSGDPNPGSGVYSREDFTINDVSCADTYSLIAGVAFDQIWIKADGATVGSTIGTTPAGTEVMMPTNLVANVWLPVTTSWNGPLTLYFENFCGIVQVAIFKRLLP